MDLCIECQANPNPPAGSNSAAGGSSAVEECTVAWGACNVLYYRVHDQMVIIFSSLSSVPSPAIIARLSSALHLEMAQNQESVPTGQS
jgi:hypothetical protein